MKKDCVMQSLIGGDTRICDGLSGLVPLGEPGMKVFADCILYQLETLDFAYIVAAKLISDHTF